eukprot:7385029-Prymnesium_polylepis.1
MQLLFFERALPGVFGHSELSLLPPWTPFGAAAAASADAQRASELGYTLRHVSCSGEFERALERALATLSPTS